VLKQISNPHDLLVEKLAKLEAAEQTVSQLVPKLEQSVSEHSLKDIISLFRKQSTQRISRIGEAKGQLKVQVESEISSAFEGLVEEVNSFLNYQTKGALNDLGLLPYFQKMLGYLVTDYSYVTNLAYVNKIDSKVQQLFKQSYSQLQDLSKQTSSTAEEILKKLQSERGKSQNQKKEQKKSQEKKEQKKRR
jgi:ferritin-like metal-binding protein YciE